VRGVWRLARLSGPLPPKHTMAKRGASSQLFAEDAGFVPSGSGGVTVYVEALDDIPIAFIEHLFGDIVMSAGDELPQQSRRFVSSSSKRRKRRGNDEFEAQEVEEDEEVDSFKGFQRFDPNDEERVRREWIGTGIQSFFKEIEKKLASVGEELENVSFLGIRELETLLGTTFSQEKDKWNAVLHVHVEMLDEDARRYLDQLNGALQVDDDEEEDDDFEPNFSDGGDEYGFGANDDDGDEAEEEDEEDAEEEKAEQIGINIEVTGASSSSSSDKFVGDVASSINADMICDVSYSHRDLHIPESVFEQLLREFGPNIATSSVTKSWKVEASDQEEKHVLFLLQVSVERFLENTFDSIKRIERSLQVEKLKFLLKNPSLRSVFLIQVRQ
jgi:hypothetical protein